MAFVPFKKKGAADKKGKAAPASGKPNPFAKKAAQAQQPPSALKSMLGGLDKAC